MQLNDFNLSTSSLSSQLIMNVKVQRKTHPVSELIYQGTQLLLINNPQQPPLSLEQFRTRTSQLPPHTKFYFGSTEYPLFGYQIDRQRLVLA